MTEQYNGWTNYETWLVNLWLDNDGGGERWREEAERVIADNTDSDDHDAIRDNAVAFIADEIKAEHEAALDEIIPEGSGVFQDLLSASLRHVNWHEIAEHYVDDAMPEGAE